MIFFHCISFVRVTRIGSSIESPLLMDCVRTFLINHGIGYIQEYNMIPICSRIEFV